MATLEPPSATNGTPNNPSSPVPLDTIPISPADGANGPKDTDTNGDGTTDENTRPSGGKKTEHVENDQITVFHDPDNFNVKHPLMHEWTLWFTKPPSGKVRLLKAYDDKGGTDTSCGKGDNWNELLKEVVTFDSVEEFWGVYVSLPLHQTVMPQSQG